MPPTETQTLDRKVLEVVKRKRPTSADEVVSAVRSPKVTETAILEAIWRLVRRMQLELTATRELKCLAVREHLAPRRGRRMASKRGPRGRSPSAKSKAKRASHAGTPPHVPGRSDRLHLDEKDQRTPFARDRDRILYTTSLRRLAGVTQVVAAGEPYVFHNRLTHTLEVAQIARRIAERLLRDQPAEAEALGGIDPEVAEAAALGHDSGTPAVRPYRRGAP